MYCVFGPPFTSLNMLKPLRCLSCVAKSDYRESHGGDFAVLKSRIARWLGPSTVLEPQSDYLFPGLHALFGFEFVRFSVSDRRTEERVDKL